MKFERWVRWNYECRHKEWLLFFGYLSLCNQDWYFTTILSLVGKYIAVTTVKGLVVVVFARPYYHHVPRLYCIGITSGGGGIGIA